MQQVIDKIRARHPVSEVEIRPPASKSTNDQFQQAFGKSLPFDFKDLYQQCNGFTIVEDQFNFLSLEELLFPGHFGENCFYFAEI